MAARATPCSILPPNDREPDPAIAATASREFVRAGLTVVGARPQHSPSLENYPRCDTEVQSLAKKLWG